MRLSKAAMRPEVLLAALTVLVHLITAGGYGIFRDEFYYLACADHLGWGYVDHPPLSIALLALVRFALGDSPLALRLLPALLHGFGVWGTARLAACMGAEGFGRMLAALCVAVAPGFLGMASLYSMNALDLGFHVAAMLVFAKVLRDADRRAWLLLGWVVGLGLLNKYSMGFLVVGLSAGLLVSPRRRDLLTPWPWLGGAFATVLFLPHIAWQVANDWPTREFIANAQQYKIANISPFEFLMQSWLEMLPPSITVWLVGLVVLFVWRPLRAMRPFGVAWLVVLATLLLQRSKPYYLNVTFPMLFAAGGVAWEALVRRPQWRWLRPLQVAGLGLTGILIAPYALPVLPPATFVAYNEVLGITPQSGENHEMGPLPQHFADRFGWEEMAETVAVAWRTLTPEEQRSCLIVGRNYGQAGALRYYGRALGLPPAVSQHNSFYLWGLGGVRYDVVISIGQSREDLMGAFLEVTEAARFDHPYVMPYERNSPIYVCRGWRMPVDEAWRLGRMYI